MNTASDRRTAARRLYAVLTGTTVLILGLLPGVSEETANAATGALAATGRHATNRAITFDRDSAVKTSATDGVGRCNTQGDYEFCRTWSPGGSRKLFNRPVTTLFESASDHLKGLPNGAQVRIALYHWAWGAYRNAT